MSVEQFKALRYALLRATVFIGLLILAATYHISTKLDRIAFNADDIITRQSVKIREATREATAP